VGTIGPLCSSEMQAFSSSATYWTLPHISPGASSPALMKKALYPYFYSVNPLETQHIDTWMALWVQFRFKRVAFLALENEYFRSTMERLQEVLAASSIELVGSEFATLDDIESEEGTKKYLERLHKKDARIILVHGYQNHVRKVMCDAYKLGMTGPGYAYFYASWLAADWWMPDSNDVNFICTPEEMYNATQYMIGSDPKQWGDPETILPNGESLTSWRSRYEAAAAAVGIDNPVAYGANCHDTAWTWAKALDAWLQSGRSIGELRSYSDDDAQKAVVQDLLSFIQNTSFHGATGHVSFSRNRERLGPAWMEQLRPVSGQTPGATLSLEDVRFGLVEGTKIQYGSADNEDVFTEGVFEGIIWPGGSRNPPLDDKCPVGSIPNEDYSQCTFCQPGSYRDGMGCKRIGHDENFVETWKFYVVMGAVAIVLCSFFILYVWHQFKEKADLRKTIVELEANIIISSEIEFQAGKELGRGASGVVQLTIYHGTKVAKKTLISNLTMDDRLELQQEAKLMSRLRHPNCVLYMGVQITKTQVTILTEFCSNGSLFDVLHSQAGVSWEKRLKMGLGVVLGLQYLHANGLCHCDLKSPNILIDEGYNAKIADFGLSRKAHSFATGDQMSIGTPRWCAPEVMVAWMERKRANAKPLKFSPSQDVFSLGTILWELDTMQLPFTKLRFDVQVCDEVISGGRPADIGWPSVKDNTPAQLAVIVQKCWSPNPDQRPTLQLIASKIGEIKIEQATHGRFVSSIGGKALNFPEGSREFFRRISGATEPPVSQGKVSFGDAASAYHQHLHTKGREDDDSTLEWSPNPIGSIIELVSMSRHLDDLSNESGLSIRSISDIMISPPSSDLSSVDKHDFDNNSCRLEQVM
jgi:serine/threonine protein kinase